MAHWEPVQKLKVSLYSREAFCKDELEQGQYLLQLRAAAEAEDLTCFWHDLFCQAKSLGAMYWCNQGSRKLQSSAEQACAHAVHLMSLLHLLPRMLAAECSLAGQELL